jgi:copper chaperone CopZ
MTETITTSFTLSGLTCPACEKLIQKRVKQIAGVTKIAVDLKTGKTDIVADHSINTEELSVVLKSTPYKIR